MADARTGAARPVSPVSALSPASVTSPLSRVLRLATGAFALGTGAALYGLAEAHAGFVLRRRMVSIDPTSLRESGARLRILHLSDLHLLAWHRKKLEWVKELAELKPDLLVLTGDSIASPRALAPLLDCLDAFDGVPGAFVFGSNDYYQPKPKNPFMYFAGPSSRRGGGKDKPDSLPWREMAEAFEDRGLIDLNNVRGALEIPAARDGSKWTLSFVGVDDPHLDRDVFPAPTSAPTDVALHIGLAHAPYKRVLDSMVADGCDLAFAGHTHGGQVCVPGHGALVTNCDLPAHLVAGLYRWPNPVDVVRHDGAVVTDSSQPGTWVNVSAGMGTSPFAPVRVACRPEAIVLDVVVS